jgi:hypothetical protein
MNLVSVPSQFIKDTKGKPPTPAYSLWSSTCRYMCDYWNGLTHNSWLMVFIFILVTKDVRGNYSSCSICQGLIYCVTILKGKSFTTVTGWVPFLSSFEVYTISKYCRGNCKLNDRFKNLVFIFELYTRGKKVFWKRTIASLI